MLMSRMVLSGASRSVGRRSLLLLSPSQKQQLLPIFSNQIDSLISEHSKQFVPGQVSLFHHSALSSSPFQRFGFTSSASPETNEKEEGSTAENNGASRNADAKPFQQDRRFSF
uniref:GrpE n=1 Tax=Jatropha curcas TaxID=180498 RepID=E9JFX2_JATCU|nr:GrpE [Jatropha curcas]